MIVLVIGFSVGLMAPYIYHEAIKPGVSDKVRSFYEIAFPGVIASIESIKDDGGLYKVLLKLNDGQNTEFVESYVTKDGSLITDQAINLDDSISQLERSRDFVNCLFDSGVRIFGVSNHTASLLQLNILGLYSPRLFVSCEGENAAACVQAGISEVPTSLVGNFTQVGVQTAEWFAENTGCRL